ncbi:MAG: hypothetical protein ACFB9N_03210 [Geitlerinemataceae cyanobacterium]
MSSSPRSPQASPPPRRHWLVALTAGLFRGLGSLLTAIANRLEANPSDPRASAGVWGLAVVLGVAIAVAIGRMPTVTPEVATDVAARPAIETRQAPEPAADSAEPEGAIAAPDPPPEILQDDPSDIAPAEPLEDPDAIADLETPPAPISAEPPPLDEALPEPDEISDEIDDETQLAADRPEEIPNELTAPDAPQPLKPAPPPPTPEQRLVAALQQRIATVSDEYAESDLVTTVRVDFAQNHLDIEVSDRWYDLGETEQDRVAENLRDRGLQFDFYDFSVLDVDGRLLARQALVGDGAIVMRRLRD